LRQWLKKPTRLVRQQLDKGRLRLSHECVRSGWQLLLRYCLLLQIRLQSTSYNLISCLWPA
jgi:hypothetical protein